MKSYTDKVLLLDGTALVYRSFYALFKNPLRNSRNENVSAIHGVIKTLIHIDEIHNPKYIAFCFDAKGKTKRKELYPQYKATRQKIPDELLSQIPKIIEIVSAMGFNFIEMNGYEADDIIASIARQNDKYTLIISSDKDIAQIVNERINIATSQKPDKILDEKEIYKKYGVYPSQMVDYLALVGDTSDNIPGVPGIGPKTATLLLGEFKNIDNIYKNIDKIRSKRIRENLLSNRERLNLAITLVKLNDKLDVGHISSFTRKDTDVRFLLNTLKGLELYSLTEYFSKNSKSQLSLFSGDGTTKSSISTEKEYNPILAKNKNLSIFFLEDFIALNNGVKVHVYDKSCENDILSDIIPKCEKIVTNNAKRIYKFIFSKGLHFKNSIEDIKIASSLIFGGLKRVSEKNILLEFIKDIPLEDLKNNVNILSLLAEKSSVLWEEIEIELKRLKLLPLYQNLEMPLAEVLALMEHNGILVDKDVLETIKTDFAKRIESIIEKCKIYTGDINLNSPKQLSILLFDKLKLPVVRKTKTGRSTDNETLIKLSKFHPLPSLIIEYREYNKFKTSYIDNFPSFIGYDGKIHTTYNQINVDTGRLSSNNPNLQNIPARSDEGKRLRKIFIATSGYKLVSFDYSQIELRIMAYMSRDKHLREAFNNGADIHKRTAALIFGTEEALVTSDMRRKAKVINFGIMYGMSPYGLSKELGISLNESKRFIENYFSNYVGVKEWIEETVQYAKKNLYVKTMNGRIRYIPTINSKNKNEFEFSRRIAINTPIQGSAAEIIKLSMVELFKKYGDSESVKMLLQIHDELIFEIEESYLGEINIIRAIMENTADIDVPLTVTVGIGNSWFEASK